MKFDYVGTNGSKKSYEAGLDDETLSSYAMYVTFKDRDDFKAGKEKIEEYVKSISDTKSVLDGYTWGSSSQIEVFKHKTSRFHKVYWFFL